MQKLYGSKTGNLMSTKSLAKVVVLVMLAVAIIPAEAQSFLPDGDRIDAEYIKPDVPKKVPEVVPAQDDDESIKPDVPKKVEEIIQDELPTQVDAGFIRPPPKKDEEIIQDELPTQVDAGFIRPPPKKDEEIIQDELADQVDSDIQEVADQVDSDFIQEVPELSEVQENQDNQDMADINKYKEEYATSPGNNLKEYRNRMSRGKKGMRRGEKGMAAKPSSTGKAHSSNRDPRGRRSSFHTKQTFSFSDDVDLADHWKSVP